jgi:hypothetical protein
VLAAPFWLSLCGHPPLFFPSLRPHISLRLGPPPIKPKTYPVWLRFSCSWIRHQTTLCDSGTYCDDPAQGFFFFSLADSYGSTAGRSSQGRVKSGATFFWQQSPNPNFSNNIRRFFFQLEKFSDSWFFFSTLARKRFFFQKKEKKRKEKLRSDVRELA